MKTKSKLQFQQTNNSQKKEIPKNHKSINFKIKSKFWLWMGENVKLGYTFVRIGGRKHFSSIVWLNFWEISAKLLESLTEFLRKVRPNYFKSKFGWTFVASFPISGQKYVFPRYQYIINLNGRTRSAELFSKFWPNSLIVRPKFSQKFGRTL